MVNPEQRRKIQKMVESCNYPDSTRITQEIVTFLNSQNRNITTLLDQILTRLNNTEPWDYIRGWSEFKGLQLQVTPNTLIPRIETEVLVDNALQILNKNPEITQVVDVGTGSGAIIISVATFCSRKNIKYVATDISKEALSIARKNADSHKTEIDFVKADLINTSAIDTALPTLILANLPYLTTTEYNSLDPSVKEFEPKSALLGGQNGYELYLELIKQTEPFTQPPKQLWELSPMIIPEFTKVLHEKKIPHKSMRDQFDVLRFIEI